LKPDGDGPISNRIGRVADTGEALLSHVADRGSDLLVMGAYGHARLRQLILGGVTQTIMGEMTVPVLMSR